MYSASAETRARACASHVMWESSLSLFEQAAVGWEDLALHNAVEFFMKSQRLFEVFLKITDSPVFEDAFNGKNPNFKLENQVYPGKVSVF